MKVIIEADADGATVTIEDLTEGEKSTDVRDDVVGEAGTDDPFARSTAVDAGGPPQEKIGETGRHRPDEADEPESNWPSAGDGGDEIHAAGKFQPPEGNRR